jgi:IS1 family transposase
MNKLDTTTRSQVIAALVEGNSIHSTSRMTGVSRNTIAKLLADLGAACAEYMDKALVNLPCKRVQCDEIWSFVGAKQKNLTQMNAERGAIGDVWTWVAIDADTKLVPSWLVGSRDADTADTFIRDLAKRLKNRVQLTTDGHKPYLNAIEGAFRSEDDSDEIEVDYAMLIKIYGKSPETETRYSPAECTGSKKEVVFGNPERKHISTSYIERQNLTMRMGMRRFTRLTNGFSKKVEFHIASIAIHYMHYNFCRIHQSLRVTPAMEAGISNHVWSIEEIAALLPESQPGPRGPYRTKKNLLQQ